MSADIADATRRVSTGVPGLDRMLGGGLIAGRPYLLTGGSGSGKTLLGLTFLLDGLRRGEEVLLVAVDEPPSEILENVLSFGWDLSPVKTLDANPGLRGFKRMAAVQEIRAMNDLRSMRDLTHDGSGRPSRRRSRSRGSSSSSASRCRTRRSVECSSTR